MIRIVLNIDDDKRAADLLSVLQALPFVDAQIEQREKIWTGKLDSLNNPIQVDSFRPYTKEELNDRPGIH